MNLFKCITIAAIITLTGFTLSGYGYDHSEIQAAKAACDNYKGTFNLVVNGQKTVVSTRCTVDGIKYRIGRTQYELLEGEVQ